MGLRRRAVELALIGLLASTGCGARTALELGSETGGNAGTGPTPICGDTPSPCIVRGRGCEPPGLVDPSCDEHTGQWSCPSGSRPHARARAGAAPCLPFRRTNGLETISGWGLSSLVPLPVEGDRCLWIANSIVLSGGASATNVAFEADPNLDFGACPEESIIPPTPIVTLEGGDDPSLVVAIYGSYRISGETRVLYRLFQLDPTAVFGAIILGGGLARYDLATQRIVVPSPARPFPWGLDLDLGDAVWPSQDENYAFVWGCARPGDFLEEGCVLSRIDGGDSIDVFDDGTWLRTTDASRGSTIFMSGPWLSSIADVGGRLRHVYSIGFGSDVRFQSAPDAQGPWSSATVLSACELPSRDPNAFCAGPIVRPELFDPTRPGELVVTDSIGTTGQPTSDPDDYWPRLVWLND